MDILVLGMTRDTMCCGSEMASIAGSCLSNMSDLYELVILDPDACQAM